MSTTSTLVVEARTTCPSCAAVNPSGSPFCWQCYTRFPEAAPGPPEWARPDATGEAVAPAPPARAPASPARKAVAALLAAAMALGGFLVWRSMTGGPFPGSFRTYDRLDSPEATRFEEGIVELGDLLGVEIHGAQYGNGSEMAVLAVVAEEGVPPEQLGSQLLPATSPRPRDVLEVQRDGATFLCFPADDEVPGAACTWIDRESVGVVYGRFMKVRQQLQLTAELRAAVS